MADRPRDESAILRGWVILRLNFRFWRVTFRANVYGLLDRRVVVLQLRKKLCSRLYSIEIEYYFKKQKNRFWPPCNGDFLSPNVGIPSIARWKARGRLHIRHNWTLFAISYGWDVISGDLSKSAFSKGGGSLWAQLLDGKGRRPPTAVGVRKLE